MGSAWDDILTEQRGRFVLFVPVFMAAGILAYLGRTTEPSLAWCAGAVAVSGALTAVVWARSIPRAGLLCAFAACVGFALACLTTARAPPWPALPHRAVVLIGRITLVEVLPEGRRITLAAASLDGGPPLARTLRIRLRDTDAAAIEPGETVQVRAMLRAPPAPDYPGGRDTQREAFFAGLAGYGFAIGPTVTLRAATGDRWTAFRARVAARIMAGLPGPPGAVAATLLTGLGSAIPPADRAAFQDSGLAHLLAVAGLHIGIVMGLVFAASRFGLAAWEHAALYWPTRKIAALLALAAGGIYLALTGAHVPILRSFAMAALVTLGVLTGRRAVSLRGLAVAALVLMLLAPDSVAGASFQMSFASVLTLIAGAEMARPLLLRVGRGRWWRRPALYVAGLVLTSLLAGTAALPFAAYHFGRATLYYVPANMLAVPLTALWVMPCGLAALLLMPVGLETLALVPMGWGVRGLIGIAHAVAAWPAASFPVPQAPGWGLALVALGLAFCGLGRGALRLSGVPPLALGLAAPLLVRAPDIVLGAEARLIAMKVQDRVVVERGAGATIFDTAVPARIWGTADVVPFTDGGGECSGHGCRFVVAGHPVLLARDVDGVACSAGLILSAIWLHDRCLGTPVLDRRFVTENGATMVFMTASGPGVVTDRAIRGDRPWVLLPRRTLPWALTE